MSPPAPSSVPYEAVREVGNVQSRPIRSAFASRSQSTENISPSPLQEEVEEADVEFEEDIDDEVTENAPTFDMRDGPTEMEDGIVNDKQCQKCNKIFRVPAECRRHVPKCTADTGHCKEDHRHEPLFIEFKTNNSFEDAETWFLSNRYDSEFIKITGDKLNKDKTTYRQYRCNMDEKSKRSKTWKPKIFRPDRKHSIACNAYIKIQGNKDYAILYGCTAHSHENELFNKRVPQVKQVEIVDRLKKHMRKEEILKFYCHEEAGQRIISLEDIRRLEKRHLDPFHKLKPFDRLQGALRSPSVRAFNLDTAAVGPDAPWTRDKFDEDVAQKWVPSQTNVIVHISDRQRRWFSQNPRTLIADGSHNCGLNNCFLCSAVVLNRRSEGRPAFNAISWAEDAECFSIAMKELKKLEPDAWARLEVLMSDIKHSPKNAYEMTEGHAILQWVICNWHFRKAQAHRPDQERRDIYEMEKCTDEGNLRMLLDAFRSNPEHENSNFLKLYGFGGSQAEPTSWSCAFVNGLTKTSMHIESWHNQLKNKKTGLKRQANIPEIIHFLNDLEAKLERKDDMVERRQRNAKPSYAMALMTSQHPPTEWTVVEDKKTKETYSHKYTWKVRVDGEKVIVNTREHIEKDGIISFREKERWLKPNRMGPCIGERCLVRCRDCQEQHGLEIACGHGMICDCYTYKKLSLCKHQHMVLNESPLPGAARSGCVGGVAAAGVASRRDHQYLEVNWKCLATACFCKITPAFKYLSV